MTIVLVADDIRSAYNIGSLLRTADAFGVSALYCCGVTPYVSSEDKRPPHVRAKNKQSIAKTALGAEQTVKMIHSDTTLAAAEMLRGEGFEIIALEQSPSSVPLRLFKPADKKYALILGTETTGLSQEILGTVDQSLEIPMSGQKESLNVTVAAAIALWHLMNSGS